MGVVVRKQIIFQHLRSLLLLWLVLDDFAVDEQHESVSELEFFVVVVGFLAGEVVDEVQTHELVLLEKDADRVFQKLQPPLQINDIEQTVDRFGNFLLLSSLLPGWFAVESLEQVEERLVEEGAEADLFGLFGCEEIGGEVQLVH